MKEILESRLKSLAPEEKDMFYERLLIILNDRYSCFAYGGVTNKEYSKIPQEKLEKIKFNLYRDMFCKTTPPLREFPPPELPLEEKAKRLKLRFYERYFNSSINCIIQNSIN